MVAAKLFDAETMAVLWKGLERSEVREGGTGSALFESGESAREELRRIVESKLDSPRRRTRAAAALAHGTREHGTPQEREALRTWLLELVSKESDPDVVQVLSTLSNEFILPR